jgi:hypothetical protein
VIDLDTALGQQHLDVPGARAANVLHPGNPISDDCV